MSHVNARFSAGGFGHVSWKYYNTVKKKAMEQEFSWSGLVISLSIAFFVVVSCSLALNAFYKSLLQKQNAEQATPFKVYHLEGSRFRNSPQTLVQKTLAWEKILSIPTASAAAPDWQAAPTKPTDYLKAKEGETISYVLKIKNTGGKIWPKEKIFLETGPFLRSLSKVKSDNWLKYYRPAGLDKDVKPGESASVNFTMIAPAETNGDLQENFQLVIDGNQVIAGSLIRIFISVSPKISPPPVPVVAGVKTTTVKQPPTITPPLDNKKYCIATVGNGVSDDCQTNPNENDKTDGSIDGAKKTITEPIIRIGLFNPAGVQRVMVDKIFDVYSGQEIIYSGLAANEMVIVGFDQTSKQYSLTYELTKFYQSPIRIVPRDKNAIVTLLDYTNSPKWNITYNDNQFRNNIEFNYSKETGKLWVINELPIESYLRGLAETSNYSPVEFQKVMITAARSYAIYHYLRGVEFGVPDGSTKHAAEHFHLDATYDQVYRGYGSEKRLTTLVEASNLTKGSVVTHQDKPVITPYFSRSDGRTRSWEEVWYGEAKPWLKSVAVPEEIGKTLWGHGVGMSAQGGLLMVVDGKKTWQQVLSYFYQGTAIQKIY